MLAADAEAARVIAIESSAIAKNAQQIVVENQLDQVVTILRGEVDGVELPFGIKEVDVIISEWVGHGLFSKNKLASLIFARDKWLAPNGLIFPDRVRLFIGGAEGALWREERYGFWNQVQLSCVFVYPCTRTDNVLKYLVLASMFFKIVNKRTFFRCMAWI